VHCACANEAALNATIASRIFFMGIRGGSLTLYQSWFQRQSACRFSALI
jgi:hypothetical protein